jgi:hypothetical protein
LNLTFTCDIKNDFNDGKRVSDALRNYSVWDSEYPNLTD